MKELTASDELILDSFYEVSDEELDLCMDLDATALTTCSKSAPGGYCN